MVIEKSEGGKESSTSLAVTGRAKRDKIAARDQTFDQEEAPRHQPIRQFDDIEALKAASALRDRDLRPTPNP